MGLHRFTMSIWCKKVFTPICSTKRKFFIILNNIQKASISEYLIYTATSYRDEKKRLRFNAYFFPKFIIFLYGFHFRKGQEIFYRYCSLNGYLLEVLKSKSTSKAFGSKNYFLWLWKKYLEVLIWKDFICEKETSNGWNNFITILKRILNNMFLIQY